MSTCSEIESKCCVLQFVTTAKCFVLRQLSVSKDVVKVTIANVYKLDCSSAACRMNYN